MPHKHLMARFVNLRFVQEGNDTAFINSIGQPRMLNLPVCQPRPSHAGAMHNIDHRAKMACGECNRLNKLRLGNHTYGIFDAEILRLGWKEPA